MTQENSGSADEATQGREAAGGKPRGLVVGRSVDLDGTHGVGAGQRRQRRQMVQLGG